MDPALRQNQTLPHGPSGTRQAATPPAPLDVRDRADAPVDYRAYPILVVDDEPENLTAFELNFKRDFTIITATSGPEALALLDQHDVALIVTDQRMPGMNGVTFLEQALEKQPHAVRMVLTGYADISSLIASVNSGRIWHYITKPWDPGELRINLRHAIDRYRLASENHRLVHELKQTNDELARKIRERTSELEDANKKLTQLAVTDGLTGLYNHRYFQDTLDQEILRGDRFHHPVSVVMIDVDHFKNYNDTHGHPAGDEILKRVAFLLVENVREVDTVARYGGEEFIVILPETGKEHATKVAEKIRSMIAATPFPHAQTQPMGAITVCAGVASTPEDAHAAHELVEKADRALYQAKRSGRNRVQTAES